jgi:hypothetical protein
VVLWVIERFTQHLISIPIMDQCGGSPELIRAHFVSGKIVGRECACQQKRLGVWKLYCGGNAVAGLA